MDNGNKLNLVAHIAQGMLAHPRRYKPRVEDVGMHWHDALMSEAFDLADAAARVAISRGMDDV